MEKSSAGYVSKVKIPVSTQLWHILYKMVRYTWKKQILEEEETTVRMSAHKTTRHQALFLPKSLDLL